VHEQKETTFVVTYIALYVFSVFSMKFLLAVVANLILATWCVAKESGFGISRDNFGDQCVSLLQTRAARNVRRGQIGSNVVVAISTLGNLDFVKNWARSLELSGVREYYVYAVGPGAFEGIAAELPSGRVRSVPDRAILFAEELQGDDAQAHWVYGSEAYSQLMLSVPGIVKWLLEEQHESFLYTDTDVVALSDPFASFPDNFATSYDLLGSSDSDTRFMSDPKQFQSCNAHVLCGGLWWVQRSAAGLAFVSRWAELAERAPRNSTNQPLYNKAAHFVKRSDRGGLRVGILSCERFPNGARFFHQPLWRDSARRPVAMIHANFLKGEEKKRLALAANCLWRPNFQEGHSNATNVPPLKLPNVDQAFHRVILLRRFSSLKLASRLDTHRQALLLASRLGLALVVEGDADETESSMLGLQAPRRQDPAVDCSESRDTCWELDAAAPMRWSEDDASDHVRAFADECFGSESALEAEASAHPEAGAVFPLCSDASAASTTSDSAAQIAADLWYRRRSRVSLPVVVGWSAPEQVRESSVRVVVPAYDSSREETLALLRAVTTFLGGMPGLKVEIELVQENLAGVTGIDPLFSEFEATIWAPPRDGSTADAVATLERLASAALIVVPRGHCSKKRLWRWAGVLSRGLVLAPRDMLDGGSLAERRAAGATVAWDGRDSSASFDAGEMRTAWRDGCMAGWDNGNAAAAWANSPAATDGD